jgi:hypothetical protein
LVYWWVVYLYCRLWGICTTRLKRKTVDFFDFADYVDIF